MRHALSKTKVSLMYEWRRIFIRACGPKRMGEWNELLVVVVRCDKQQHIHLKHPLISPHTLSLGFSPSPTRFSLQQAHSKVKRKKKEEKLGVSSEVR